MLRTTGDIQEGNRSTKEHYLVRISYELVREMSLLMFQTNSVQAEADLPDCGGNGSTQTAFVLVTHVHAWTSSKLSKQVFFCFENVVVNWRRVRSKKGQ